MADRVSRDEVIRFRLSAHHLTQRLGGDGLLDAAAACGVQNSPPGSALLALGARVQDLTESQLDAAVAEQRTLLQTWSVRGAPFFFPTTDAHVFTTGVLPATPDARRQLVIGVAPALESVGLGIDEAVGLIDAELDAVLRGRRLAINELGAELADRVATRLDAGRKAWQAEGPYSAGQPLGEAIVHFCLRILTLQGRLCLAPRSAGKAPFVLVDEWLDGGLPETSSEDARAELLRRYLHSYGPSSKAQFATWLGLRAGDATAWWDLLADELAEVDFDGRAWLLAADLPALRSAPDAAGVRLLPPRDPYTQLRDRETILAKPLHGQVWRPLGEPGTVLVDGQIAGVWRPNKAGRRLTVTVQSFDKLSAPQRKSLAEEAELMGTLRGASDVELRFD